ncbi:MAG: Rpn family recombination-promoting nuclease/putative transposase [Proteobacteria bacterium]|nr:Rpn family recombination-promoting nuclease/putative transposase [Pseudomonadota bacterium]
MNEWYNDEYVLLSPKLDIVFKRLFTDNLYLLRCLVSDLLNIPRQNTQNLVLMNNEVLPDMPKGKTSRLDLRLEVDGKAVNIEIQIRRHRDYAERALFYWAKLFTSSLKSGEEYGQLKKTITVNIVDFDLFSDKNVFHSEVVAVIRGTDEIFCDKESIHFFELSKIDGMPDPVNRQKLWLQFLNVRNEEDLKMIENTETEEMKQAADALRRLSLERDMQASALLREMELHDEASLRAEGREEARKEMRKAIMNKMRQLGYSESQIQEIFT